MEKLYIDTPAALEALVQRLANRPWLALDTEFMRETTYYPRLCLLQISDGQIAACVDPIALETLDPILQLLFSPDIIKVFHAARQDLEIFQHRWQRLPAPVFDTQLAAALLGQGDQVGYGNLVEQMLGVRLAKGHSRTDWTQRPLDSKQIDYAYDDVIYLAQLYPLMHQQLAELNRLDWLRNDFEELVQAETYITEPSEAWKKVKGQQLLRGVQYAVLQSLADWRERQAEASDRPRRRLLADEVLIDMARRQPKHINELAKIRGIADKELKRWGDSWLDAIAHAQKLPKEHWPNPKFKPRLSLQEEAKVDLLAAAVKLIADQQNLSPNVLASRKDLEDFVSGDPNASLRQGWKKSVAADRLDALLKGQTQIGVVGGMLQIREVD